MPVVRVGFVGLGMRGPGAVARWMHIPGIEVVALCDYEAKRAEACQKILRDNSMPAAAIYSGEEGLQRIVQTQGYRLGLYRNRLGSSLPRSEMCYGKRQTCCY